MLHGNWRMDFAGEIVFDMTLQESDLLDRI
jgi:hypothetical protein